MSAYSSLTVITAVVFVCDAAVNIAEYKREAGWDILAGLLLLAWTVSTIAKALS